MLDPDPFISMISWYAYYVLMQAQRPQLSISFFRPSLTMSSQALIFQSHDFGSNRHSDRDGFFLFDESIFDRIDIKCRHRPLLNRTLLSLIRLNQLIKPAQTSGWSISLPAFLTLCFVCNLYVRKAVLISKLVNIHRRAFCSILHAFQHNFGEYQRCKPGE